MKALIFNSGIGSRMQELTKYNHKSMLKLLNGETVFERQIRILSECGIKDFVITVGHFKDQLISASKRFSHLNFIFIDNKNYNNTNYIYSMFLASSYLDSDMLILHGDLVFNKKLVIDILESKTPSLCLYNQEKKLPEKDFKGRIQNGYLKEVSVNIFDEDCFAFQPFYKLSEDVVVSWKNEVESFIKSGNDKVYAENALNKIMDTLDINAFSYIDNYIEEIDDANDYKRVCEEIRYYDYREQKIYQDGEFNNDLEQVLKNNSINKIFLVGSENRISRIKQFLQEKKYNVISFSEFSPNPKYEEIKCGVDLFTKGNCNFIISIGGGSSVDVAKSVKAIAALDNKLDFLSNKYNYSKVKHLAIPTTAGTGSESTRFAVIYYKGEKFSITHDSLLPEYAILGSKNLLTLPDYVKKTTMLDALCQAIESYWSIQATHESKAYAVDSIKIILQNYKLYLSNEGNVFGEMLRASNLSGKAINISTTTAPHAMSYKLTSMYGISHGHAVGLCLPSVWRYMCDNINQYKQQKEHLIEIFMGLAKIFKCNSVESAIAKFEELYKSLNLKGLNGLSIDDIQILVNSVDLERLDNHPVSLSQGDIEKIYNGIWKR